MYSKVRKLTGKNLETKSSGCIIDKNGKLLFDKEEIAARWVEYIIELYDDDRDQMPSFKVTTGDSIYREEVEKTMRSMKDGKVTRPDVLPAEALKAFNDYNSNSITDLCNIIYYSGVIPVEMRHSMFVTIPKKPKAKKCAEYRTISLMSHMTKLQLEVIQQHIVDRIDEEVSQLQSAFRPGTGARESIFNLRTICKRSTDVQKDIYICSIDYNKAFDRVKHDAVISCLAEIGIYDEDLQTIPKLYWEQSAAMITRHGITSDFKIKKGVRQGCALPPNLFNLYTERILKEVEDMRGVRIGGVNINKLR